MSPNSGREWAVSFEPDELAISVLDLGRTVKDAVQKQGMLAWQYNTIGVSDAITMGGEGVFNRLSVYGSWAKAFRYALLPSDKRDHRRQYRDRDMCPTS